MVSSQRLYKHYLPPITLLESFNSNERFCLKMPQLDTHEQAQPPLSSNIPHPLKNFRFDPIVTVGYTWSKDTYDRTPFIQATSNALTSKTRTLPTPRQNESLKSRFFLFQWQLCNADFQSSHSRSEALSIQIMNPIPLWCSSSKHS